MIRQPKPGRTLNAREEILMGIIRECTEAALPIPTIDSIAEKLDVALGGTVPEMFRRLQDMGLIINEPFQRGRRVCLVETGKWSAAPLNTAPHWRTRPKKVPAPAPIAIRTRRPDIAAEIEAHGSHHGLDLIRHIEREADPDDRARLSIAAGPVLDLTCLHRADGRAFALERRLINLTLVPAARMVNFARESPGRWLMEHVPWSDAAHRISATAAGKDAMLLGVVPDAPCLSIERWTWRTRERITYVRQVYPDDHALASGV